LVAERSDENTWKSFANLGTVHVLSPGELNAYDVLVSDVVVFTKATLPIAAPAASETVPAAPVETSDDSDMGEEE
jgi:large subunit ribosomal protein L4